MLRKPSILVPFIAFAVSIAHGAGTQAASQGLTAAQIVDKNVAARGGLQAWREVKSIQMEGKLGAGGNRRDSLAEPVPGKKLTSLATDPRPKDEVQLPFKLLLSRPRKERFELQFNGQTALQVFDGSNGWKLRPYLNRREIEPYTSDELKIASAQAELDGYLIDYAAKGTKIELDGSEKVEGRDAYKLKLTLSNGQTIHVWIDAQTFLESKIEGQPRRLDGIEHPVEVYYRNYRAVSGLQIPFTLETRVLPVTGREGKVQSGAPVQDEKIDIEKVEVNPNLNDSLFSRPQLDGTPSHR